MNTQQTPEPKAPREVSDAELDIVTGGATNAPPATTLSSIMKKTDDTADGIIANMKG